MFGIALRLFFTLTLLTGVAYPLFLVLIGQSIFYEKAEGSWIKNQDRIVGSKWIGQQFTEARYFWGRPSASNYDSMASGGSNLGPTNPILKKQIHERVDHLKAFHPGADFKTIPIDLLYASGSGLDPDISLKAALFQVERVAKARGYDDELGRQKLIQLIESYAKSRPSPSLASAFINVLELNMALDQLIPEPGKEAKHDR